MDGPSRTMISLINHNLMKIRYTKYFELIYYYTLLFRFQVSWSSLKFLK